MNNLPAIVANILAVLATDLGAIDLSGSDQVKEGTYDRPPGSVAFACLTPPRRTQSEPFGRGPDYYLESYQAEIRLWAPVTNSTTDNHAQRSRLVAAEAQVALDAVRPIGLGTAIGRCVLWAVDQVQPDPAGATALPGWARSTLTVEFTFRRASGSGT